MQCEYKGAAGVNTNLPKIVKLGKHNNALGHPVCSLTGSRNLCSVSKPTLPLLIALGNRGVCRKAASLL
jgi:hypothetical protein